MGDVTVTVIVISIAKINANDQLNEVNSIERAEYNQHL